MSESEASINFFEDDANIDSTLYVDYGGRIFTDSEERQRAIESMQESLAVERLEANDGSGDAPLDLGVSVILPTYAGLDRVGVALQSLIDQDLSPELYEIIVIVNGQDDGSVAWIDTRRSDCPQHSIRVLYQPFPNASSARNLGVDAARHRFVTFVDDDDYVGTRYLSNLLSDASPSMITVAPIINVRPDGSLDRKNSLNAQISARKGRTFKLTSFVNLIGFNACKLIPTAVARNFRYSESLRSGEDICYMTQIALSSNFDAVIPEADDDEVAYYRTLRDDSISRQPLDLDFAVAQRLLVIRELEQGRDWQDSERDQVIVALSRSQANFIRRYLDDNPEDADVVRRMITLSGIRDFPWSVINSGKARDLVVSYCFSPYSDTSAVVASKAIVERGNLVDVVSNNMTSVRRKDANLEMIAARYIAKKFEVTAPVSFAGWDQVAKFVEAGLEVAERQDALIGGYQTVYSRVLWVGSHFLASIFKMRHPEVIWTAEFSDPLSRDANGKLRAGEVKKDALFERIRRGVESQGYDAPSTDSLFAWCEHITYIMADNLVFTNENQLEYMLDDVHDKRLRALVRQKAIVRHHPTPPEASYDAMESQYQLSKDVLNIGYFGAFYDNRGLHDVLIGIANLHLEARRKIRLHVFTNRPTEFLEVITRMGLTGLVRAQGYVPYLEFLNLSRRFDVLLVNDIERSGEMRLNPFLPSKYSDYLGAGKPIWGLVDEGSPLSLMDLRYKSPVGNSVKARETLEQIHRDWEPSIQASS